MAKQTVQDEFSISMIQSGAVVVTAGTLKAIVVGCLGTREDNSFTWSEKVQLEVYPDVPGEYPTDPVTHQAPSHVRLVPVDILLDLRAVMLALEDFLQTEVSETNQDMPQNAAQARARYDGKDPRMDVTWRTVDGHNSAPGHPQVPRPQDRVAEIKG